MKIQFNQDPAMHDLKELSDDAIMEAAKIADVIPESHFTIYDNDGKEVGGGSLDHDQWEE